MEFFKCRGNLTATAKRKNENFEICVSGDAPPLRAYSKSGADYVYQGLLKPDNGVWKISATAENVSKIILTDGRIGEEYEEYFSFVLEDGEWQKFPEVPRKPTSGEDFLFSHPVTKKCVDYHGYYLSRTCGDCTLYAFPSDFYTHPLPHLLPYAYWYKVDLGYGEHGYFVISHSSSGWAFPDAELFTKQ